MSRERRESQKCGLRLFLSGKEVIQKGTSLSCRAKQEIYPDKERELQRTFDSTPYGLRIAMGNLDEDEMVPVNMYGLQSSQKVHKKLALTT